MGKIDKSMLKKYSKFSDEDIEHFVSGNFETQRKWNKLDGFTYKSYTINLKFDDSNFKSEVFANNIKDALGGM